MLQFMIHQETLKKLYIKTHDFLILSIPYPFSNLGRKLNNRQEFSFSWCLKKNILKKLIILNINLL